MHVVCSQIIHLGIKMSLWFNKTNHMMKHKELFLVVACAETRLWNVSVSHSSYFLGSCCCDVILPQKRRVFNTTTHWWKTTLVHRFTTTQNINKQKTSAWFVHKCFKVIVMCHQQRKKLQVKPLSCDLETIVIINHALGTTMQLVTLIHFKRN